MAVAVGVAEMTGLVSEIMILLLYRLSWGILYFQIGLLMASFMAGLSLGAFWISRNPQTASTSRGPLIWLQIILGAVPLLLWAFLEIEPGIDVLPVGAIRPDFLSVYAAGGFSSGGATYLLGPVCTEKLSRSVCLTAGGLYGADLLGAAWGACSFPFSGCPPGELAGRWSFLSLFNLLLSLASGPGRCRAARGDPLSKS